MRLYVDELRGIPGDSVRRGNSINSLSVKHPSIYDDVKTTWYAEYDFEYANDMEAVRFYLTGEWENMQANGYDRVWNCGNECWVMRCE